MNKYVLIFFILMILYFILSEIKKRLLYKPIKYDETSYNIFYNNIKKIKSPIEELIIPTDDNNTIHGLIIHNKNSKKYLLFCHGNDCNITHLEIYIKILHPYVSLVLFDYTSFGKSDGPLPTESILKENILAVWNHLTQNKNIEATDIILMGDSLGAAVVIWCAGFLANTYDMHPHSVIIQSGFSSLSNIIPNIPVLNISKYFLSDEYNSYKNIQLIGTKTKILIMHDENDENISGAIKLYSAATAERFNSKYVKFHELKSGKDGIKLDVNYINVVRKFI